MLAGKAGVRQILGRRAGTYCEIRWMKLPALERVVGGDDFLLQVGRDRGAENQTANPAPALAQRLHVAGVETGKRLANPLLQSRFAQQMPVRRRHDGKAVGHVHTLGPVREPSHPERRSFRPQSAHLRW